MRKYCISKSTKVVDLSIEDEDYYPVKENKIKLILYQLILNNKITWV